MNESIIEVVFKVHADVRLGEELRVCGSVPALGCDNPDRAVPMVTTPTHFPWWRTKEGVFIPGDPKLTYRYCIFSGGKFDRWENDGTLRRTLQLERTKGFAKQTEDMWGILHYETRSPEISPVKFHATEGGGSGKSKHFAEWSKRTHVDSELNSSDGVIVVSYFLPVVLSKDSGSGAWSASWDKENLLSLQLDARLCWIGTVRYQNAPIPIEEEEAVSRALAELSCYPVFLNQNMHVQFYDLFCKQNLWPIMHHNSDVYGPLNLNDIGAKAQQSLWFVYSTVHKMFREKVLEMYQSNYLIWIHGFHLLLLPSFLRRRIPSAKIGYFFHTPFPSSEIWRIMSRREDLLRGILGADQVGFHLYEYARHFVTTCQRLMGCSSERSTSGKIVINVDGRDVSVTCIHVGVDFPRVEEILVSKAFENQMRLWKNQFKDRIIVAGIDRLERLKGIPLKLMAIDQFMEENDHWKGKIVFTLVGISANERGQDYRQTQHDVKLVVQQLNDKYAVPDSAIPLIHFEERLDKDIRIAQRLPFFAVADILMITATRDGLNRYPMEYTLARKRYGEMADFPPPIVGEASQGLVVISEFISSARVMRGALMVNPWRVQEVKLALSRSLNMAPVERADRMRRNLEYSTRLTTSNWATQVLNDLKSVEKSSDPDSNFAVGFGMQYKIMDLKAGFNELNSDEVCKAYRTARHRLILLDWGGTLVSDHGKVDKLQAYAQATGHAAREVISEELQSLLEALTADVKNYVFVVSGKEQPAVAAYWGGIRGLGLGAEHGFYHKWPRDEEAVAGKVTRGRWQTIMEIGDQTWKETAKMVMDIFVQRTHGTYIEQKGNALIWQFKEADPEFGYMQSKELMSHLNLTLSQHPVEVMRGGGVSDGYVEVRPRGASKGLFTEHCLSVLKSAGHDADFVLAVGDDTSDEPMFEVIEDLRKDQPTAPQSQQNSSMFAVTVGKKPTAASAYVDDPAAVLDLLYAMSKCSQRETRYFSTVDLPSQARTFATHPSSLHAAKASPLAPIVQIDPKPAAYGNSTTAPILRSTSAGDLKKTAPRKSLTTQEASGEDKSGSIVRDGGGSIQRITSAMNLSMMDYMKSLNDSNQEDDGAIFF
eukprot:CAMPEP_0174970528 /NCGR_PEP_ID=MMETSP0004_2-20121128/9438_1 /TAXON_ID=420556 /ORGANISM="Ochromonas sp., Strain CCMP1393" /LENGTH=1105 /DNA_ID=CAMNT_0016220279 /DNA_START=122 /DNA_END=3439 /DNA_ORIENTATION=-